MAIQLRYTPSTTERRCHKKAVAALVFNRGTEEISYSTILQDGKTEVKGGVIPPGFATAVQPNGELGVLIGPDGKPRHSKLYDLDNAFPNFQDAVVQAALQDMTITTPEMVQNAAFHGGIGRYNVETIWARSLGRAIVCRFPIRIILDKPSWGSGAQQVAEFDSALVYNLITGEVYFIGTAEVTGNWQRPDQPNLTRGDLLDSLPKLTWEQFQRMFELAA